MSREKEIPDSILVARAKEDPQDFGPLYEKYVGKIFRHIYIRTGNRNVAEDLTAEVFRKNLEGIDRWEDIGYPYSTILYRSAHNAVYNWRRDRNRRKTIPLHELVPRPEDSQDLGEERIASSSSRDPEEMVIEKEEHEVLHQAIRRLPPDRQQLIVLKLSEGLSNREIGQIMGRTEGAIKTLYYRTLNQLHEKLTDGKPRPRKRSLLEKIRGK